MIFNRNHKGQKRQRTTNKIKTIFEWNFKPKHPNTFALYLFPVKMRLVLSLTIAYTPYTKNFHMNCNSHFHAPTHWFSNCNINNLSTFINYLRIVLLFILIGYVKWYMNQEHVVLRIEIVVLYVIKFVLFSFLNRNFGFA